jgi:hypothetical protein
MNEDKLTKAASQLAKEITPERDLWPGIEAAIVETAAEPRRGRRTPMLAQAAAVALLVGASSSLTYLAVKDDSATVVPVPTPNYEFSRAAFGTNYTLGPGYQDAHADLASKLDEELAKLSPEERDDVERTLAVIREAINDINVALAADPDNAYLQELLQKTYREELTVMRRVGGLTRNVMLRNDI